MKMLKTALAALFIATAANAQYHKYDTWDENYTVQALLGAVKYENLKFSVPDSEHPAEVDVSILPQLGGAWSTLPKEGNLQFGLECSLLLGFKFDKINYLYLGGNGAYVSLSTSMWMFDLAGGAYANLLLGEDDRIRIYAGAGPLMTYAAYSADKNYSDSTTDENYNESAFGVGVYARTGIEIRIHYRGLVGLGARWNWASVDFTEVGGSSDLVGVAGFITYTAGF